MRGIMKWFNIQRGYGFATTGEGFDVFVHYKNILGNGFKSLADGDEIEFDVEETPKGKQARNIKLIKRADCLAEDSTYSETLKKKITCDIREVEREN